MSAIHFYQSLVPELQNLLTKEPFNGQQQDGYIRQIVCPKCGEPEAYTQASDPTTIHCNRKNNCGSHHHAKSFASHLFENFQHKFPATKDDPKLTARAYLQSRRLDTDRWEFEQGFIENHATISVKVAWSDKRWHRLIDYRKNAGKNRWDAGGSYSGKAYTTGNLKGVEELYIVEGIFDCWSLEQSGIRAAATFSAGAVPDEFYESLPRNIAVVIALDADTAGERGIPKNIEKLEKLGFKNITVALPHSGRDWNDLLVNGDLSPEKLGSTLQEALHQGRLHTATSAQSYAQELWIHAGSPETFTKIFDFANSMYLCKVSKANEPLTVEQIANASIRVKFVQVCEAGDHSLLLEFQSRRRSWLVESKVEDILSASFSEVVAKKTRAWVTRTQFHLQHLYRHLNYGEHPEIRDTGVYGFDGGSRNKQGSGWYTFDSFAFNTDGQLVLPEKGFQYFHLVGNRYIRGDRNFRAAIKKISDEHLPVAQFVAEIYRAYGGRGLLALGFWFAGLFSEPIFKEFGFFPFLSMFGDPAAGKSTLGILLNRALSFADWEGIPMSRTNSLRGPQRQLAAQSGVAVPLLEWTPKSKISEEDLLNLYGRNPQQVRATNKNDSTYIEVPFNCALVIITNSEPFTLRQVKERIISLRFSKDELNDETTAAAKLMMNRHASVTASVGVQLLQDRIFWETNIVSNIKDTITELESSGVTDRRIADNHGIPLGGLIMLLARLLESGSLSQEQFNLYTAATHEVGAKSGKTKIKSAQTEFEYADDVLQQFDERIASSEHCSCVKHYNGLITVRLIDMLDQLGYPKYLYKTIKDELKAHDRFVGNERSLRVFGSKKQKVWEFQPALE